MAELMTPRHLGRRRRVQAVCKTQRVEWADSVSESLSRTRRNPRRHPTTILVLVPLLKSQSRRQQILRRPTRRRAQRRNQHRRVAQFLKQPWTKHGLTIIAQRMLPKLRPEASDSFRSLHLELSSLRPFLRSQNFTHSICAPHSPASQDG